MNNFMKMIIVIPICTVLLFLGSTYAYYTWSTVDDEKTYIATKTGYAKVFYDAGANLTEKTIIPVLDKKNGITKTITVRTDKEFVEEISFNLYLDINILDEKLKHQSFKFEIFKEDTLIESGNFSDEYLKDNTFNCDENENTKHIVLIQNDKVKTKESVYTLYIWIDGNMENPINMTKKNFDFTLHADGMHAILSSTIPEGGTYIRGAIPIDINNYDMSNATVYTEGMDFPKGVEIGDIYQYGDYEYVYGYYYNYYFHELGEGDPSWQKAINWDVEFDNIDNGWGVRVIDSSKDSYGNILEVINGANVINLSSTFESTNITKSPTIPSTVKFLRATFQNCQNLEKSPPIPTSVIKMNDTFSGCSSLFDATAIPNSVFELERTFLNCTSLTEAPIIPKSVTSLPLTFSGCTSLVNAPVIPSSVTILYGTFSGCTNLVTAPAISNSVTDISFTFSNCTSLVNAPAIPNSVMEMYSTFSGCESLVTAPVVPESVESMEYTFSGCSKLSGIVRINSKKLVEFSEVFDGTIEPITLEIPSISTTSNTISSYNKPDNITINYFE